MVHGHPQEINEQTLRIKTGELPNQFYRLDRVTMHESKQQGRVIRLTIEGSIKYQWLKWLVIFTFLKIRL